MKFGGSSIKGAQEMKRVIDIIKSKAGRKSVIVLSACGGITDNLLKITEFASSGDIEKTDETFKLIEQQHLDIIDSLVSDININDAAKYVVDKLLYELKILIEGISLLKECTPKTRDSVLAYGELLSTNIFEYICEDKGLSSAFLDAREIIRTDSLFNCANVDINAIHYNAKHYLMPLLKKNDLVVTQGFIGSDSSGCTTTIGRGGSDYTAALIGASIAAGEIQIWTDVSGALSADPRLVSNPITLESLSFNEIRELSFFGAKVLHPDTIKPAMEKNIVVRILNTFEPDNPGTSIRATHESERTSHLSLTLKDDILLASPNGATFDSGISTYAKILKACGKKDLTVYGSVYTDGSFKIIFDKNKKSESFADDFNISIAEVSILVFCGEDIGKAKSGAPATVINCINNFNPHSIIFSSSGNSIIGVLPTEMAEEALKYSHEKTLSI